MGRNMGFEVACGGLKIPRRDGGKLDPRAPPQGVPFGTCGDIDGNFFGTMYRTRLALA